jgi:DNA mismatch endonuclease (patch repair protein)
MATFSLPPAPPASSPAALRTLTSQRRSSTKPELALRRVLHARGLRYRVDRPLPGLKRRRADLTFPTERVAVFVDGCFWHACPSHGRRPVANGEWWEVKLSANTARDRDTDAHLAGLDWCVVRAWEHEDPVLAADRVEEAVRSRRAPRA